MIKNYLKIAYRNLVRNKVFSFINIFGLAIGLTTCLLIMLYVLDEASYDTHHKFGNRTYRIASVSSKDNETWSALAAPIAWHLKNDLPEVEQVTRLLKFPTTEKMLLKYQAGTENRMFFETNGYYVDSTFFQIFSYEFIYGDMMTALNRPNIVVLSEQVAAKLFKGENPIGKPIVVGIPYGDFTYEVTGVFRNKNNKSHIPAHFLLSMKNGDIGGWVQSQTNWAMNNVFHTYIRLRPSIDAKGFDKKLNNYISDQGRDDIRAMGISKSYFLQPIKEIYLRSNLGYEISSNGNIKFLYILGSIAAFILFIACINFMNLATARSEKRAKEVGVRKVMGAVKNSLVFQFLGESFIVCFISLAFAIVISSLLLPFFNDLTGKNLDIMDQPKLLVWMALLIFITGLLAGIYPAFYLSSFRPISVLKGKILNSLSASAIRKGLVIFQFAISICLILGAIVIWQQLKFVRSQPLGFEKNQKLVIPLQSIESAKNYRALRNDLLKIRGIKNVTSGSVYPGVPNVVDMLLYAEGKSVKELVDVTMSTIENDYFETLGLELLHGRTFSEDYSADSSSLILNETALKAIGYDPNNSIGRKVNYVYEGKTKTLEIVGVVKDFNFESLHKAIKPFGFTTNFFGNKHNFVIANIGTKDYARLFGSVQAAWTKINPSTPFNYSFLDEDFQRNYEQDQKAASMVIYFTIIAIAIACLDLFGLVAFSAEQRKKEIGIRKVLGASVSSVTALLSKDFMKLVIIAMTISMPIAWYCMSIWLRNFEYRIHISWWMFALAGFSALIIALITVSFQSIKASLINPVKNLRSE